MLLTKKQGRYNRQCNHCGSLYYACSSCIDKNSWKNVCCSVECFQKMIVEEQKSKRENIVPIEKNIGKVYHMYGVNEEKKTRVEIIGYDLSLGRFDDTKGNTHEATEFDYFEVSFEELKEVALV